jgi:hypothetical protein
VEHPCYKCGSPVEDGTAFCRHCGAAQIRVASDEVRQSEPVQDLPSTGPLVAASIQWSQALGSALLAGLIADGLIVIAAGFMFIPYGAYGLGMISAGILVVLFYCRRNPGAGLSPGMGARLGMVSGVLGFGIFTLFIAIQILVFHSGGQLRAAMLEKIEQSALRTSDPQTQQYLTYFKSPPGLALLMALTLLGMFFASLIFASLGGTLAATLLRRREKS